jgi:hypothetical protein
MAEGFLGRWSQRKLAERQGGAPRTQSTEALAGAVPDPAVLPAADAPAPAATGAVTGLAGSDTSDQPQARAPAPTMQDVAALHKDSDFKPFVSRAVQPEVRNAALKKMFSDPHFNVMDGLDTYIDDYSKPDPLPLAMMRKMASAQFLQLFDDDKDENKQGDAANVADVPDHRAELPREDADGAAPLAVAQSAPASDMYPGTAPNPDTGQTGLHDDDTDLRLQPDDAAGPARPGRGTE